MGVWSVGLLDTGITDEAQQVIGTSRRSWDFYYGNADTDGGRPLGTHHDWVAREIYKVNPKLERIDYQISSNYGTMNRLYPINNALSSLKSLHDAGEKIGAYNMSWGGPSFIHSTKARIDALADRGVIGVAASGNGGVPYAFENASFPARMPNVISVGSHDGSGNPSLWSQNSPNGVHILANGEANPLDGTSFAAPDVAATVATIQAIAEGVTTQRLSFGEVVGALQLGGSGPLSAPDYADRSTQYHLHTHSGTVDYTLRVHIDPVINWLEYVASFNDIETAFGWDAKAARSHFLQTGVYEGRTVSFDSLEYVASYGDLLTAIGANRDLAMAHYLNLGRTEGREITFDPENYLNMNLDVRASVDGSHDLATYHYISFGYKEGRPTGQSVSEGYQDLPWSLSTRGYVGVGQSATGKISGLPVPNYWSADRDMYKTNLISGQSVIIEARGVTSGGGSLKDPEIILYDSNGNFLTFDWDSGAGKDAYLHYTPSTSGTFHIGVMGWNSVGTYTVSVKKYGNIASSKSESEAAYENIIKNTLPAHQHFKNTIYKVLVDEKDCFWSDTYLNKSPNLSHEQCVLNDQLIKKHGKGNRGNDTIVGEDGIETFVFSEVDNWVMDFDTAQHKIEAADAYSVITQSVSSGNLVLTDSDGDTLTLLGVTSTLSEGYFV